MTLCQYITCRTFPVTGRTSVHASTHGSVKPFNSRHVGIHPRYLAEDRAKHRILYSFIPRNFPIDLRAFEHLSVLNLIAWRPVVRKDDLIEIVATQGNL